MRSVLRLILPGGALLATPLQPPWALRAMPLRNSRKAKTAESKIVKAINGQLLSIRSRSATVTPAATTTVAQIEFAASQKRQEVTKLAENERDEPLTIRLGTTLDKTPLKFPSPLIVVFYAPERNRLLALCNDEVKRCKRSVPLCPGLSGLKKQSGTLRLLEERKVDRFAYGFVARGRLRT